MHNDWRKGKRNGFFCCFVLLWISLLDERADAHTHPVISHTLWILWMLMMMIQLWDWYANQPQTQYKKCKMNLNKT